MKLEKGFYVIGRDKENSKTFILGSDVKRCDTLEEAEKEQEATELEMLGNEVETKILKVEEW